MFIALIPDYIAAKPPSRAAERSMIEISELQTTLAANLETQTAMIDDLVLESLDTRDDVASGNKELKRAADRKGPARWVFRASCGLCVFLILWDFFI
jgi:syntaxin 18